MPIDFNSALVTGGAGFIGSHLVDTLAAQGCRVTILDNLSTGKEGNVPNREGVRLIRGDIRDESALAEAVAGVDVVFHLAAVVSVVQTTKDPLGTAAINETASIHVLEAARRAGVARFIFASSCAIYGDDPTLPKREEMLPSPITPYAAQKMAVEYHVGVYRALHGIRTASLRFFNVYGPRQDPSSPYSGVISIFIIKALKNEPPVIFGDGLQTRDFIFVADIVEALISASTSPSAAGSVFNVGSGEAVAINDLWARIATLSRTRVEPVRHPRRAGEVIHSRSSIDNARERLGFAPQVTLDAGLKTTFDWYKASLLGPKG